MEYRAEGAQRFPTSYTLDALRRAMTAGDSIITKKPHPCGNSTFAVLRVGMDFRIRCTKCGREVMVPRSKIEKNIKKVVREALPL